MTVPSHIMAEEEAAHTHSHLSGESSPAKMAPPHDHEKQMYKEAGPARQRGRRGDCPTNKSERGRGICIFIILLLLLLGITALTLWLVYRPHHPRFRVINAAVYQLNTSIPPFIAANMQFAVLTRNPNRRVSILYDPLSAYVSYKNMAITPPVILPPLFLDTKSTVALSPLVGGAPVPVAAELGNALAMDEAYGVVELRLVLTGKLRYKGGPIKSRHFGVYVTCDLLLTLKKGFVGQLPLLASPPCRVHL